MRNIRRILSYFASFLCFIFCLGLVSLNFSCVTVIDPPFRDNLEYSNLIMDKGVFTAEELAWFLRRHNRRVSGAKSLKMAQIYVEECCIEGVNHDVAFSQMCIETGFLKFGGSVKFWQHNYCGLGAISASSKGLSFSSMRIGIRAQIQHLKAYGSEDSLLQEIVDPRFKYVKRGKAPTVVKLAGTWASDPKYGEKLKRMMGRIARGE